MSQVIFGEKRYRSFDYEMKQRYGSKVVKLSVDGGFSCPNRINSTGCIFCTERGSGEFCGDLENLTASISDQIEFQRNMLSDVIIYLALIIVWINPSYESFPCTT